MINLATYNIWNSEVGMPLRKQYLVDEIKKVRDELPVLKNKREDLYEVIKK